MIAGVLRPQRGTIQFGGEALAGSPVTSSSAAASPWCRRPAGFPADDGDGELQLGAHIKQRSQIAALIDYAFACFRACSSGVDSWPAR